MLKRGPRVKGKACKRGWPITSDRQQKTVSVHGSIPHHERKIKYLKKVVPVRSEVSKGEWGLNARCQTDPKRAFTVGADCGLMQDLWSPEEGFESKL